MLVSGEHNQQRGSTDSLSGKFKLPEFFEIFVSAGHNQQRGSALSEIHNIFCHFLGIFELLRRLNFKFREYIIND